MRVAIENGFRSFDGVEGVCLQTDAPLLTFKSLLSHIEKEQVLNLDALYM